MKNNAGTTNNSFYSTTAHRKRNFYTNTSKFLYKNIETDMRNKPRVSGQYKNRYDSAADMIIAFFEGSLMKEYSGVIDYHVVDIYPDTY